MTLFINAITQHQSGIASFSLPDGNGGHIIIDTFLSEDPTVNFSTKWESALPDISMLNDFTNIWSGSSVSWLSTSKAAWKGTDPLIVDFEFYLLTYLKEQVRGGGKVLPVTKQAAHFAKLCTIEPESGSDISIKVHGGYKPSYFERNSTFMTPKGKDKAEKDYAAKNIYDQWFPSDSEGLSSEGTVQVIVNGAGGRTLTITDLLLADISFNTSTVRAGFWENGVFQYSGEPLYIKVSAKFRLSHAATTTDAIRLFTGGTSL